MAEISTKPYLIRAIHEWCTDSGYRPYIAVAVDERTVVPRAFVRNGEIVLNVSHQATNRLVIGNELIEFEARFGGVPASVSIPIDNVSAIYAQETGHGMAFDVPKALALVPGEGEAAAEGEAEGAEPPAAEAAPAEPEAAPAPARPKRRPKLSAVPSAEQQPPAAPEEPEPPEGGGGRPRLTRVK